MTERRQRLGRAAYAGVVAGLAAGIVLNLARLPAASALVLAATCGLLIALPAVNVIFVIADEVRRRDWLFALLAAGVLLLIGFTLASRLLGS